MSEVKPEFLDAMHIFAYEMGRSGKLFDSCEKTYGQNMIRTITIKSF